MILDILSVGLVLVGGTCLAFALPLANEIRTDQLAQPGRTWALLALMVAGFIAGYIAFALILLLRPTSGTDVLLSMILAAGGAFVLIVMRKSASTVGEIKRIAALERHRAMHDDLTDLPNRVSIRDHIRKAVQQAGMAEQQVAVLVMDVDRFKEINDTLGHHIGDVVLKQMAERLRATLGEKDVIARQGGDEFVVVLSGMGQGAAVSLCQRILPRMEPAFHVDGHNLVVGLSIGIAVYPEHGSDAETLLQRADVAMYVAKRSNGGYAVYDPKQDTYTLSRLTMGAQMRDAIKNGEMVLHYQPKIDIPTGQVISVEALVRWNRPGHGLVSPEEFIPLAEETGLIRPLTTHVLNAALCQAEDWRNEGVDIEMAVNISTKSFWDDDFVDMVQQTLLRTHTPPSRLTLEITESSLMEDPVRAYEIISELSTLGVQFSIDDFGTGYSSLAYLKQLPAGKIKIDKSFVMDMTTDENDAVIVRAIIDLAHNMGREVVAEGVESKDAYDLLEILGCNFGQGFHICRPLPAADIGTWLKEGWCPVSR
ncbi:MAG: EAL domain-containing protein [Betaproteobacteria bacterium]|nr:EAL domain-containing protein [Betaproteobacteria bacterium]